MDTDGFHPERVVRDENINITIFYMRRKDMRNDYALEVLGTFISILMDLAVLAGAGVVLYLVFVF